MDLLPHIKPENRPQRWTPRHRLVVALALAGYTNAEIAATLDVSEGFVSSAKNDPRALIEEEKVGSAIADRIVDASMRIKLYANEAIDEIVEQMRTAADVKVRQKAAFGILDRGGYGVQRTVNHVEAPKIPSDVADRMESALEDMSDIGSVTYKVVDVQVDEPALEEEVGKWED